MKKGHHPEIVLHRGGGADCRCMDVRKECSVATVKGGSAIHGSNQIDHRLGTDITVHREEIKMKYLIARRQFLEGASAASLLLATGCSDGANEKHNPKKERYAMDYAELIEARRSVRRYTKSEISKDEMEKIVADALNAPSWKNSETTRYYAAIGAESKGRMWKEALPGFNAANSANAAALVAVTFVPGESGFMGSAPADDLGDMWGAYDCGLASSYFILAAKNRGWDTLIMGIRDTSKVKQILGIPAGETLMSVIAVGKASVKPVKVPRKLVAEVLKAM